MTLTDWQKAEIKVATDKYLGKRNQEIAAYKDNLRVDYRIDGQSVYIFKHRKSWQGEGFDDFDVAKNHFCFDNTKVETLLDDAGFEMTFLYGSPLA